MRQNFDLVCVAKFADSELYESDLQQKASLRDFSNFLLKLNSSLTLQFCPQVNVSAFSVMTHQFYRSAQTGTVIAGYNNNKAKPFAFAKIVASSLPR